MTAAVWSCSEEDMLEFPVRSLVTFWRNHHLLEPAAVRPRWRVVSKRGREYVRAALAEVGGVVVTGCEVERVERGVQRAEGGSSGAIAVEGVRVFGRRRSSGLSSNAKGAASSSSSSSTSSSSSLLGTFDAVVLATHADDSLRILEAGSGATPRERSILGAIEYGESNAVLHSDVAMMPRAQRAWSAWNYVRWEGGEGGREEDGAKGGSAITGLGKGEGEGKREGKGSASVTVG